MGSGGAMAGSQVVPDYCATKAFDMLLAEGLWYEFKDFNISVVCPLLGQINTPTTQKLFKNEAGADPEETAQEILDNLENGPTVFTKSIRMMVPIAWTLDRRKAVLTVSDAAKAMFPPETNTKPFDPAAVVR
jgi:short-subunit dehydrogenase